MEKYELGQKMRADRLGLKGREYLTYCKCSSCEENRWVRREYIKGFKCIKCKSRDSIKAKKMNGAPHLKDCECLRCKISLGCLKGKNNPSWHGGKKNKAGYTYVYIEDDSPFISMVSPGAGVNYVAEHRLVMAEKIGRCLTKSETVHHINGIKDDNRIENLELWSSNHQSGQRLSDQIRWAKELLINNGYTINKRKKS